MIGMRMLPGELTDTLKPYCIKESVMPESNEMHCPISSFVDSVGRMLGGEAEDSIDDKGKLDSICRECAISQGGRAPKVHCATMYIGECNVCGEDKKVSSYNDWIWSDNDTQAVWD